MSRAKIMLHGRLNLSVIFPGTPIQLLCYNIEVCIRNLTLPHVTVTEQRPKQTSNYHW
jgi:hypothetical protein